MSPLESLQMGKEPLMPCTKSLQMCKEPPMSCTMSLLKSWDVPLQQLTPVELAMAAHLQAEADTLAPDAAHVALVMEEATSIAAA